METLVVVLVVLVCLKLIWDKIYQKLTKKNKKSKPVPEVSKADEPRAKAISNLMENIQKAKLNRPELIEENPQLAAKILKTWVQKDKKDHK